MTLGDTGLVGSCPSVGQATPRPALLGRAPKRNFSRRYPNPTRGVETCWGGPQFPPTQHNTGPIAPDCNESGRHIFFSQEEPTSCPYRKRATRQHTPRVPSSNWTPNPIPPTPSAAVIPDWTTISSGLPVSTHHQLPTTLHRQPQ